MTWELSANEPEQHFLIWVRLSGKFLHSWWLIYYRHSDAKSDFLPIFIFSPF